jgi:AraC-like DNA-binding protein
VRVQQNTSFVSLDGRAAPAALPPTDLLSAVLRELRLESAAYRWLELGAPFRIGFDQPGLRGVHLVTRGMCNLVLDNGTATPLTTGDLAIVLGGDPHWLCSPGTAAATTVSSFDLAKRSPGTRMRAGGPVIDTVVVCGAFLVGEPDHPVLRGLPRTIHLPGTDGQPPNWLASLVAALQAEAYDGGPGSDLFMARLSDAVLVRALRHYGDTVDQPGWLAGLRDPYVAAALAAMHADIAHPWDLTSLARTSGLSRAAFAARFTKRVGVPAMRYLLSLRMQRAKTLLRDQKKTIASVASQVGYQSDIALAAAFKREVGHAPGAYRRRSPTP